MKGLILLAAVALAACASYGAQRTSIAQSCRWVVAPVADTSSAARELARTCACAARGVEAEWEADRLARFDAGLAEHARRMEAWTQRTTIGGLLSGISEPPPDIDAQLMPDMQAFGLHLRDCERTDMEY